MSKEQNNQKDDKALHIALVMCSFIPFFGVIISYFSKYNLVKYPLYALYHVVTCTIITTLYINQFSV